MGGTNGRYGVLGRGRRGEGMVYAHRLSFEMAGGVLLEGQDVMHSCDNPLCVNPAHLTAGTRTDNMQDAKAKGRVRWRAHPGVRNGRAKLTEDDVRAIRASRETNVVLAARYVVFDTLVGRIRRRQAWCHVA